MIVLAIDPGLSGACAVLGSRGIVTVFDLPIMADRSVGPTAMVQNKVDGRELVRMLRQHCQAGEDVQSVLEAVRVLGAKRGDEGDRSGNSVQSQGSLLRTLGTIETVLECLGWPPEYVNPQKWKRHFGLIQPGLSATQRKRAALHCAQRLYPQRNEISLAKHHNRAEALLIAHWFQQVRA